MAVYLANACAAGNESSPITVVGSNYSSLAAARSVEARFVPIIPGMENESWIRYLGQGFFRNLSSADGKEGADAISPQDEGVDWEESPVAKGKTGFLLEFLESTGFSPLR